MNPFNIWTLSKRDKTLNDEIINISYRRFRNEDMYLI